MLHKFPKIVTIGVYGFDEEGFFSALRAAGVDTFCDIRARRGVRGAEYAFANSQRLQARLTQMGIRYLHFKEVAPSAALRKRQAIADETEQVAKRKRTVLGEVFIAGYRTEFLDHFDSRHFLDGLGGDAHVAALFCVERAPAACHRSLLAAKLREDLGVEVVHVTPDGTGPCAS